MKKFAFKKNLLPIPVKRFLDISAEPLLVCKKQKFKLFSFFSDKSEYICRKWSHKNTIKCLLIILPVAISLILVGGICFSVNEKFESFISKNKDIKKCFLQQDNKNNNDLLMIVNAKTPISSDYYPNLTQYMQIKCDKKIIKNLDNMINSAKKLGFDLILTKGFVCQNTIKQNYETKLNQLLSDGYTRVRAEAAAEKIESSPNKSEYQTGLLVDIGLQNMSSAEFAASNAYKWLVDNCVDFGFIQRYPKDKVDKTGKEFSPFAFRFVGKTNARKMRTLSMCLEEYFRYVNANK